VADAPTRTGQLRDSPPARRTPSASCGEVAFRLVGLELGALCPGGREVPLPDGVDESPRETPRRRMSGSTGTPGPTFRDLVYLMLEHDLADAGIDAAKQLPVP